MAIRISSLEIESIKQQNNKFKAKFEEKVAGFINYQDNLLASQIDNIKQALNLNQDRMLKQKLALDQFSQKISAVQARTQSKILLLSKELQNFRAYYDQCFQYTIVRVNEISSKMNQFSQEIQLQVQNSNIVPTLQYVKYTHDLVKQILKDSILKTTDLKYYIDEQIYHLELQMGKFVEYTQSIQNNMADLQMVKYGNASLQEVFKYTKNTVDDKNQLSMKDSMMGKKQLNFYESKFKQIIKKVNSLSIQIDMTRLLITNENNQSQQKNQMREKQCSEYEQKLKQLQKSMQEQKSFYQKQASKKQKQYIQCESKLKDAEKSLEEQKSLFEKQLVKKQQVLKKRHQRILELEQSVHVLLEKQISMQHQLSQIKLHNLELTKQIKRLNDKQKTKTYDSQTTGEKSIKGKKQEMSVIEQKLYQLQLEYDNLYKKYKNQEEQLKKLARTPNKEPKQLDNMALSQRFLRYQKPQGNISFRNQRSKSKSITKILNKNAATKSYNLIKGSNSKEVDYQIIMKQNEKLSKNNAQLIRIKKQLQDQIDHLLKTKTNQNKQEEAYLDQVEAEIYKNSLEIQRLQNQNLKLTRKNADLQAQNHQIQIQFHTQLQKYELRAKVAKNTVVQLQRQNQALKVKNSQLIKQLNSIDDKDERKNSQTSRNLIRLSVSPNKRKILGNTSEIQDKTIYKTKEKSRRMSTFLINLQNAISSMGFPIPMCVEIDKSGFVRERKTGSYLVDQTKTPLHLSQYQLKAALESGLILI